MFAFERFNLLPTWPAGPSLPQCTVHGSVRLTVYTSFLVRSPRPRPTDRPLPTLQLSVRPSKLKQLRRPCRRLAVPPARRRFLGFRSSYTSCVGTYCSNIFVHKFTHCNKKILHISCNFPAGGIASIVGQNHQPNHKISVQSNQFTPFFSYMIAIKSSIKSDKVYSHDLIGCAIKFNY